MCYPAKDGHPAKNRIAVGLGMACYPKYPAKRQNDGIDRIVGLEVIDIRIY